MTIRKAQPKDIPRIGELLIQVCNVHHSGRPDLFRENGRKYDDATLETMLPDPKTPVFVAANAEDVVLGYCFCVLEERIGLGAMTDGKTLYIDDLCVDQACRGRNIGGELFAFAKQFAKESGCCNLTLNVWAKNTSAIRFYEKCGLSVQKLGMEMIL